MTQKVLVLEAFFQVTEQNFSFSCDVSLVSQKASEKWIQPPLLFYFAYKSLLVSPILWLSNKKNYSLRWDWLILNTSSEFRIEKIIIQGLRLISPRFKFPNSPDWSLNKVGPQVFWIKLDVKSKTWTKLTYKSYFLIGAISFLLFLR